MKIKKMAVYAMAWTLGALLLSPLDSASAADDWDSGDVIGGRNRGNNSDRDERPASSGKLDEEAVAKLTQMEELLAEHGQEEQVIAGAAPLVAVFERNKDYDHLVDTVFLLGEAYHLLADWPNAEKYMQRANDLGYQHFPEAMSTYPLKVIGDSQWEQGNSTAAIATFSDRVARLQASDPEHELAAALFDLGSAQINTEQFEDALTTLTAAKSANESAAAALEAAGSAVTEEQRQGNAVDQAEILLHTGLAHYRLGQAGEARPWLEQSLAQFEALSPEIQEDVKDRLVSVLDDLVLVCEDLGDTATAEQYRQQRDALNV